MLQKDGVMVNANLNGNSSAVQFISYKGLNGAKNRNSVLTHLLKLEVDIVFGFVLIGDSLQKSRL